jgi:DNA-binding NarL/FixJ family response regulator
LDGDNGFSSLNGSINDPVKLAEQNRRHLAIVDRSALRRDCLRLALGQQPRRWRVTDVESTADLVRLLRQGAGFSVILLSAATCHTIDLVDLSLLAAVSAKTPILVVADCDDPERARMILRSGAKGFLPITCGLKVLIGALERMRGGGSFVPLVLDASNRNGAVHEAESTGRPALTRRQRDVLALISQGKSNKLIADALGMSESTVKAHVKQIIRRLNVANRTQAALLATRGGRDAGMLAPPVLAGVL